MDKAFSPFREDVVVTGRFFTGNTGNNVNSLLTLNNEWGKRLLHLSDVLTGLSKETEAEFNVITEVVDSLANQISKGTEEITNSAKKAGSGINQWC